jgi:hypothetical protein
VVGDHRPVAGLVGDCRGGSPGQDPRRRPRAAVLWRVVPSYHGEGCGGRVMAGMRLAVGVTPMAADPPSTVARSCLVVAGGSYVPLPSGGSCFGFGGGGGRLIGESVVSGGLLFHR